MIEVAYNDLSPEMAHKISAMLQSPEFQMMVNCLQGEAEADASLSGAIRVFEKNRTHEAEEHLRAAERLLTCVSVLEDVMKGKIVLARPHISTSA